MIRILHVVGAMDRGGIENFIMNIYRHINRNEIQFDFLMHVNKDCAFNSEIESLGGNIYTIPHVNKVGPFIYEYKLKNFFLKHKYQIVHSHMNEMSGVVLKQARLCGVENRIAHSHNAFPKRHGLKKIYMNYSKKFIKNDSNLKFACSEKAGKWLFGDINNGFRVINNGIEVEKFKKNDIVRKSKRIELVINEDKLVIGHIGRFDEQKNHEYIVKIFNEVLKKNNNTLLLLVGDGPLKTKVESDVKIMGIEDNVRFLGIRDDVHEIIQVLDILLFPSIHEGLPLTLIESQAGLLKCLISTEITNEVDMGRGLIFYEKLSSTPKTWANKLLNISRINVNEDFQVDYLDQNYNIGKISNEIQEIYTKLYEFRNKELIE